MLSFLHAARAYDVEEPVVAVDGLVGKVGVRALLGQLAAAQEAKVAGAPRARHVVAARALDDGRLAKRARRRVGRQPLVRLGFGHRPPDHLLAVPEVRQAYASTNNGRFAIQLGKVVLLNGDACACAHLAMSAARSSAVPVRNWCTIRARSLGRHGATPCQPCPQCRQNACLQRLHMPTISLHTR